MAARDVSLSLTFQMSKPGSRQYNFKLAPQIILNTFTEGVLMRKWLRRLGCLLGGLFVLILVVVAVAYLIGDGKLKKVYAIPAQSMFLYLKSLPAKPTGSQ